MLTEILSKQMVRTEQTMEIENGLVKETSYSLGMGKTAENIVTGVYNMEAINTRVLTVHE